MTDKDGHRAARAAKNIAIFSDYDYDYRCSTTVLHLSEMAYLFLSLVKTHADRIFYLNYIDLEKKNIQIGFSI